MQLNIEVLKIDGPNKVKNYKELAVTYGHDGKAQVKKLVDFKYPEVFKLFSEAKPGQNFVVNSEKVDGFWAWVGAASGVSDVQTGTGKGAGQRVGTLPADPRETAAERAIKQRSIVRQFSVGTAVDLLKTEKVIPELAQVLEIAEKIETWVNRQDPIDEIVNMPDDVPA